jgi:hypothetical protein
MNGSSECGVAQVPGFAKAIGVGRGSELVVLDDDAQVPVGAGLEVERVLVVVVAVGAPRGGAVVEEEILAAGPHPHHAVVRSQSYVLERQPAGVGANQHQEVSAVLVAR